MYFFTIHHGNWSSQPPIDHHLEVGHVHLRPLWQRRQWCVECKGCSIINHVWNYLWITISLAHKTSSYSLWKIDFMRTKVIANEKYAKKIVSDALIVVLVTTLTFKINVLLYHPPWKLKFTATHWSSFGSGSRSLATFVAKKAVVYPKYMPYVVSICIKVLLLSHVKSKLYITSTPSILPILLRVMLDRDTTNFITLNWCVINHWKVIQTFIY